MCLQFCVPVGLGRHGAVPQCGDALDPGLQAADAIAPARAPTPHDKEAVLKPYEVFSAVAPCF